MTPLTSRQRELLADLAARAGDQWYRPMDLGGKDASHHSATLRQLVAKGLAERSVRAPREWACRDAYVYRATPAGRIAARERAPKPPRRQYTMGDMQRDRARRRRGW